MGNGEAALAVGYTVFFPNFLTDEKFLIEKIGVRMLRNPAYVFPEPSRWDLRTTGRSGREFLGKASFLLATTFAAHDAECKAYTNDRR